ncbi:protease IV [Bathymodiolus platifrons methanotrophic gill symbiont]|uniref:S49 family peptidase n=1 Tax=Bathymodiolus platifrons methanotrophic gill symbiont TaxID=113268 RepID=UPI0011C96B3E|nr:S49 family peptidase [Bathymodiolus platifrons methanotrophic gill symbiont]TXK94117.1 S49 family peptidase [Methylococcaceae bacterium HT1]TXL15007.1 S49 family peptidase [Methylococcaceae bacterium HT3]TXL22899.1 S49 family peptidase [Methylococcaceae bacterium HT2]GFO77081.1 protease IV [Bathymodiolus platifrons methanotrophic gill symbiont]
MSENQWDEPHSQDKDKNSGWEREAIEKLAFAAVTEQRRARRWGIFFKSLMFVYLAAILGIGMYPSFKKSISDDGEGHTAIINISGVIAEGKEANADAIIKSLRNAVKDEETKGIILHVNSPGGSPVQSSYIYNEIRKIKAEHPDLPIHAVASDICASGCYFIVSAVDNIYVNPSTLIGSIGVILEGFGFVDTMKKLGVERRLVTAGAHKALMDPFSPEKSGERKYMQEVLAQVHQQFITAVKEGRGDRLQIDEDTFSGLIWTGEQGEKFGLVDGFGSDDGVATDIIGAKKRVNFTVQERLIDRLAGKMGATFAQSINSMGQKLMLQ